MRMNHCVPHFEMEQEDQSIPIPTSSGLTRQHNTRQEDEIMELLWQNGQVVFQSQNQNKFPRRSPQPQQQHQQQAQPVCDSTSHLFMQEDEMSTWLHFPPDYSSGGGGDIYADLLYTPPPPPPPPPTANATAHAVEVQQTDSPHLRPQLSPTLPPPPPQVMQPVAPNFAHFSRMRPLPPSMFVDTGPPTTSRHDQHHHHHHNNNNNSHHTDARERESTTVVDSSDTPMAAAGISRPNRVSHHHHTVRNRSTADATTDEAGWSFGGRDTMMSGGGGGGLGGVGREKAEGGGGCLSASRDGETCELTLTSTSPGGSGASASETATGADDTTEVRAPLDDRKRKSRENAAAGTDCHSEDVEIESAEAKKQCRGSAGTKRSRAAEVHNLSERRRRDRINEKMKALQELIPRCSKTDKASMLDEAIEYLKSLQLQVQVMTSMGCGMIPMMFPGVQQYMPHMGMGMGMGMSMDMGMNRPMMPFPALLAGSALQPSGVAPHMGPRFQIPGFPMPPPVPPPDMSRIQVTGQADLAVNPLGLSGQPTLPIMPNMADPYQQYLRMQQMQNQPIAQPSTSKPSTSKGSSGRENPRNG